MIGFTPSRDYRYVETNRALRTMYLAIVSEATRTIESLAGTVVCDPLTDLLTVNDEFTASVVIARCLRTPGGHLRWKIRIDASLQADITVAIRMDGNNVDAFDYYLLPRIDIDGNLLKLTEDNGIYLDAYRCDSMDSFYALVVNGLTAFCARGRFAFGEQASFATFDGRRAATIGLRFAPALVFLSFWMFMGLLRDECNISVALTQPADRNAGRGGADAGPVRTRWCRQAGYA